MTFDDFELDPSLLRGVADLAFTAPTPIQRDAIPPALAGRDVLACAMTGSGKTAAFVLPVLHALLKRPRRGVTQALMLAPTRELAVQVLEHLRVLGRHTTLRGAAVIGGVAFPPQEKALRQGVDVIVATPGRLLDHLRQGNARLSEVKYLVVDEADRMLDMGFLPDVRRILGRLPSARQTLFFSATMPAPVARLAQEILHQPVSISVERPSMPATGVAQTVFPVSEEGKRPLLLELLRRGDIGNALVFTRTKHRADRLAAWLAKSGIPCEKIHGDLGQARRTTAMERFKSGRSRVLVATDIAARGIDVEGLTHVINFDVPKAPDDYIHRVGRTARADATGDAFTFVAASELPDLHAIERALGRKLPRRTLDSLATLPVVTADAAPEAEPTRAVSMPLTGRARYGAPVRRRLW